MTKFVPLWRVPGDSSPTGWSDLPAHLRRAILGSPESQRYERLRETGRVFFLERYGVWTVAGFADVHAVALELQFRCRDRPRQLLERTAVAAPSLSAVGGGPPEHTRVRRTTARVLSPRVIEGLRPQFERQAEDLATTVVARGVLDGVTVLAQAYPLRVFPDAVGVSPNGRENLLRYADMVFQRLRAA